MLATIALAFITTICPVSAMAGNTAQCTASIDETQATEGVFFSEECEEEGGVVSCVREDFIVSSVEIVDVDPIAGLDDCGTM